MKIALFLLSIIFGAWLLQRFIILTREPRYYEMHLVPVRCDGGEGQGDKHEPV